MRTRLLTAALLLAAALPAAAQQAKPPALQPIPEPPPPPPGYELGSDNIEPDVTIRKRGTDTVEEYRIGGRLYMIKVTPASGAPYYMVDQRGDGNFVRQDTYNSGIRPPQWVIFQW